MKRRMESQSGKNSSLGAGSCSSADEFKPKKTTIGFNIGDSPTDDIQAPESKSSSATSTDRLRKTATKTNPISIDFGPVNSGEKDGMEVFEMSPLSRTAMQYTYSSLPSNPNPNLIHQAAIIGSNKLQPEVKKIPIGVEEEVPLAQQKKDEKKATQKEQKTSQATKEKKPESFIQQSNEEGKKKTPQKTDKVVHHHSVEKKISKQVALFSHLPQHDKEASALKVSKENIHPAIIRLALMYSENLLIGANSRCISMLEAFKQIIRDYKTPMNAVLNRHLDSYMKPQINYLVQFRPLAISMGNAIRYLKCKIAELPPELAEAESKQHLYETIDLYIQNRINLADELIAELGNTKIINGDVIMVYSASETVTCLLKKAHREDKKFRVIVVDSRPFFEGKATLETLANYGIPCTYIVLSSIGFVMKQVTKVFSGAHGVFSNGYLISRVGTALIATMAKDFNVPFCVACETYKFIDKAQIDSFVYNEIADPNDLINEVIYEGKPQKILADWKEINPLKLLNIMYDVTPARNITAIITEVGMLPCSSVPVVLREYRPYST